MPLEVIEEICPHNVGEPILLANDNKVIVVTGWSLWCLEHLRESALIQSFHHKRKLTEKKILCELITEDRLSFFFPFNTGVVIGYSLCVWEICA